MNHNNTNNTSSSNDNNNIININSNNNEAAAALVGSTMDDNTEVGSDSIQIQPTLNVNHNNNNTNNSNIDHHRLEQEQQHQQVDESSSNNNHHGTTENGEDSNNSNDVKISAAAAIVKSNEEGVTPSSVLSSSSPSSDAAVEATEISSLSFYEKDSNDCFTPEALVRVIAQSSERNNINANTDSGANNRISNSIDDDAEIKKFSSVQQQRNQYDDDDVEGRRHDNSNVDHGITTLEATNSGDIINKDDVTELIASIPPELNRNRNYDHQHRPGAHRQYGSRGNNNNNNDDDDDNMNDISQDDFVPSTTRALPSQDFMVEATLVTESTVVATETSPIPDNMPQQLDLEATTTNQSQTRQQQLVYNAVVVDKSDHIVISKKSIRCIVLIVLSIILITIIVITSVVLSRKNDTSNGATSSVSEQEYLEYVGRLLYKMDTTSNQNNDNKNNTYDEHITHHMSVITIQSEDQNPNFTTICFPLATKDATLVDDDDAIAEVQQQSDTTPSIFVDDDQFVDQYGFIHRYGGIVIKLSCGINNVGNSISPLLRPMILIHNHEFYSNPDIKTTMDEWKLSNASIPPCDIVLNDDNVALDESYDFSYIQCRFYPKSPMSSAVEQFMFVFTCINWVSIDSQMTSDMNDNSTSMDKSINLIYSDPLANTSTNIIASLSTNDMYAYCTATEYTENDDTRALSSSIYLGMERLCRFRPNRNTMDDEIVFRSHNDELYNDIIMTNDTMSENICYRYIENSQDNTSLLVPLNKEFMNESYCKVSQLHDPAEYIETTITQAVIDSYCNKEYWKTKPSLYNDYSSQCEEIKKSTMVHVWIPIIPNITIIDRWYDSNIEHHNFSRSSSSSSGRNTFGNKVRTLQNNMKDNVNDMKEIYEEDDGDTIQCSFDNMRMNLAYHNESANDSEIYYLFLMLDNYSTISSIQGLIQKLLQQQLDVLPVL